MNNLIKAELIQNTIYRIRGQQVMLDSDLARLYGVEVKALNQAVHRNISRFPPEFMFQLSLTEHDHMRSQLVTASRRNIRFRPLAFNEYGIAMLSSVLRSDRAIAVNIAIMKAFINLRHAVLAHQGIAKRVERLEGKVSMHDTDIRLLVQDVQDLKKKPAPPTERSLDVRGFQKE